MRRSPLFAVLLCLTLCTNALAAATPAAADDRFKADLLLVVAHPDDETAVASYLARAVLDQGKRAAVVYLTRGESGGNQAGVESGAALGAVREVEVRRALASLGVHNVWFLGGHDTPGQDPLVSLARWGHANVLAQTVRILRLTRPEVVLTWLPGLVVGENHGDHQAAGVVAVEAFDLAGREEAFPEQLYGSANRLAAGRPAEGLRPWQAKKIYFFSDAAEGEQFAGRGPRYASTDLSPAKDVPYYQLEARMAAFHLSQLGREGAAPKAVATGDYAGYLEDRRAFFGTTDTMFVLGRSLVGGRPTADVFEGIRPGAVPPVPPRERPAPKKASPTFGLGGPWHYYQAFWAAHELTHLEALTGHAASVARGATLNVPLRIENPTDQALEVTVAIAPPKGWTARATEQTTRVAPQDVALVQAQVTAPAGESGTADMVLRASAGDRAIGAVVLKVRAFDGAMPQ